MSGFTLLESGTTRSHFQLCKRLQDAPSDRHRDLAILDTIADTRHRLARHSTSDAKSTASILLPLLHCLHIYPCSSETTEAVDISFAILPTLQLVSLASRWNDVLVGYGLLPFLVPAAATIPPSPSKPSSQPNAAAREADLLETQSLASASEADSSIRIAQSQLRPSERRDPVEGPSLLLLNTFRNHLIQGARRRERAGSSRNAASTSEDRFLRVTTTLASVAAGIPSGPAVLPSLATPLLKLTSHRDATVRKGAIDAMWRCATYEEAELLQDESDLGGADHTLQRQGGEMVQATLQVVREMLASPLAFDARSASAGDEEAVTRQIEARVEADPSVLRAAVRVVDLARDVRVVSAAEAASLALSVLQAVEWAPARLEADLAIGAVSESTKMKLNGLRARSAAKARSSTGRDYDYHGLRTPWVVIAALDSLTSSLTLASGSLSAAAANELERVVLRIYLRASQGVDAALALCISAAKCLGQLHASTRMAYGEAVQSGETSTLWDALSQHVRDQLRSANANRKVAAMRLLTALRPLGWADPAAEGQEVATRRRFTLDEVHMAALMGLLVDRDETVRRSALRLLNDVDANLVELHLQQLERSLHDASSANLADGLESQVASLLERTLEAAYIRAALTSGITDDSDLQRDQQQRGRAYAELVCRAATASSASLASAEVIISRVFKDYRGLPASARLSLVHSLVAKAAASTPSATLYLLVATLCCDLEATDLLEADSSLASILPKLSEMLTQTQDERIREAVLAALARVAALVSRESKLDGRTAEQLVSQLRKVAEASGPSSGGAGAGSIWTVGANRVASFLQRPSAAEEEALLRPFQTVSGVLNCLLGLRTAGDPSDGAGGSTGASGRPGSAATDPAAAAREGGRGEGGGGGGSGMEARLRGSLIGSSLLLHSGGGANNSNPNNIHAALSPSSNHLSPSSPSNHLSPSSPSNHLSPSSPSNHLSPSPTHYRQPRPLRFEEYHTPTQSQYLSPRDVSAQHPRHPRNRPAVHASSTSAIPSQAKRQRDSYISDALSSSIARIVMREEIEGSSSSGGGGGGNPKLPAARGRSSAPTTEADTAVLFSADSLLDDSLADLAEIPARQAGKSALNDLTANEAETSYLSILRQCHNCDPWNDETLHPFILRGTQIGFLKPEVLQACEEDISFRLDGALPPVFEVGKARTRSGGFKKAITLHPTLTTEPALTAALASVTARWRALALFPDPLAGWRNELYGIYAAPSAETTRTGRNALAFKMERAACALFGVATYGVHLTAYTPSYQIWVPRRAASKPTWPGYLDNSVAGGIVAGDGPGESVVRECEEEAALPPTYVAERLRATGVVSYCYRTERCGWVQPEVEYTYDLCVEEGRVLRPGDGEVESFGKMDVEEVKQRVRRGEFKPNCSLVLIDFFIRHGLLTPEEEPQYRQIVELLHTDLRLPGP